jgi:hypothetical protein
MRLLKNISAIARNWWIFLKNMWLWVNGWKKATPITMAKQMRVSYIVIHIWRYIIPSSESFTKHLIILPGLLNINESMRPVLVVISHNAINATARKILREMIVMWCIFCFAIYFL